MSDKKPVQTVVDGVGLNARHFVSMGKDKAVQSMLADNITSDAAWAGHAYDLMVKHVSDTDNPPKKDDAKKKEAEKMPAGFIKQPTLGTPPAAAQK